MRETIALVGVLASACAHPLPETRYASHDPVPAQRFCLDPHTHERFPELLGALRASLDIWGVSGEGWSAEVSDYDVGECVLVAVAGEWYGWDEIAAPGKVAAVTLVAWDHRPQAIAFREQGWGECPSRDLVVVLHEVGHAVGYRGHSTDPGSVMAPGIACDATGTYLPATDLEWASTVRHGKLGH